MTANRFHVHFMDVAQLGYRRGEIERRGSLRDVAQVTVDHHLRPLHFAGIQHDNWNPPEIFSGLDGGACREVAVLSLEDVEVIFPVNLARIAVQRGTLIVPVLHHQGGQFLDPLRIDRTDVVARVVA
ncbi:hypothetical protein [Burkholderia vietnamiensis]|uniref:hypothetical protein n=1 Tax=Burkholderia vietnamiensis TaxID=60552 RepID=UPI003855D680